MKKKLVKFGAGGIAALVCFVLLLRVLPYQIDDFKEIHAAKLGSALFAWKTANGEMVDLQPLLQSNNAVTVSLCTTNFTVGGRKFHALLRYESVVFQNTGCFFGTTNADVLWLDRSGSAKVYYISGQRGER